MNKLIVKNLNELMQEHQATVIERLKNPVWGEWTYDYSSKCLCFRIRGDSEDYYIPLGKINKSSQILDWIFQLNAKTWATPEVMKDLLEALDFLLKPQANYCSFGTDKSCESETILPSKFE